MDIGSSPWKVPRPEEAPRVGMVRKNGSLLFGEDILDDDQVHALGSSGLLELCAIDRSLTPYEHSLFGSASLRYSREVQTSETNAKLDRTIEGFLSVLSQHFLSSAARKTLEYLIRRFDVHQHNADALLSSVLPYHGTRWFVRVAQLVTSKDGAGSPPAGAWAKAALLWAKAAVPLSRAVLIQRYGSDPELLRRVCALGGTAAAASFSAVFLLETLSSRNQRGILGSERNGLRVLLAHVSGCLSEKATGRQVPTVNTPTTSQHPLPPTAPHILPPLASPSYPDPYPHPYPNPYPTPYPTPTSTPTPTPSSTPPPTPPQRLAGCVLVAQLATHSALAVDVLEALATLFAARLRESLTPEEAKPYLQCLLLLFTKRGAAREGVGPPPRGAGEASWPRLFPLLDDQSEKAENLEMGPPLAKPALALLGAFEALGHDYDVSLLLRPLILELAAARNRAPRTAARYMRALPLATHARAAAALLHALDAVPEHSAGAEWLWTALGGAKGERAMALSKTAHLAHLSAVERLRALQRIDAAAAAADTLPLLRQRLGDCETVAAGAMGLRKLGKAVPTSELHRLLFTQLGRTREEKPARGFTYGTLAALAKAEAPRLALLPPLLALAFWEGGGAQDGRGGGMSHIGEGKGKTSASDSLCMLVERLREQGGASEALSAAAGSLGVIGEKCTATEQFALAALAAMPTSEPAALLEVAHTPRPHVPLPPQPDPTYPPHLPTLPTLPFFLGGVARVARSRQSSRQGIARRPRAHLRRRGARSTARARRAHWRRRRACGGWCGDASERL